MSFNIPRTRKRRVVIIGGGFAGVKLARRLRRSDYQVVLVDRNNYHQFQPLIYQVASAGLEPSSISFPFRRIFRKQRDFHFRMAEAQAVDPQRNTLRTSIGSLEYDELVLAAGTTTNFYGNEHLRSHALPMKSVAEATALRNTLLTNFERALTSSSERERDELLNVVVAGGGATGVEIAGALAEMKRFVLPRDYPDLPAERMRIHLVEAGDRLLAGMSAPSSDAARRFLSRMGVEILLGKKVTDYRDRSVVFDDGSGLPSLTFIWVSGVEANASETRACCPRAAGAVSASMPSTAWKGTTTSTRSETSASCEAIRTIRTGTPNWRSPPFSRENVSRTTSAARRREGRWCRSDTAIRASWRPWGATAPWPKSGSCASTAGRHGRCGSWCTCARSSA